MHAQDIFNNKVVQAASVGVVSFAAGGVLGYFVGKRRASAEAEEGETLTFTYETLDEDDKPVTYEVTELSEVFSQEDEQAPTIELPSSKEDEDISEPSNERTIEWMGPDPRDEPPTPEEYVDISNVFDVVGDDDWDPEEELAKRSTDEPYIITADEFLSNDTGFAQTTLTYYSKDKVVTDDEDIPLYNYHAVLGSDNLKFGHGSGNQDIVYIRNVKRRGEYEVIMFDGHYAQERLGLEEEQALDRELRHAEPRRFRLLME